MTGAPHLDVAVSGGGVAGLAAAHRVLELAPSAEVRVFEAGPRPGGWLQTERTDEGYVIDRGPDSILTEKPAAMRLAERLGLAAEVVATEPGAHGAYIVHDGRLERVPEGFSVLAPSDPIALARSPLLTVRGRLRAAADLVLPRGRGVSKGHLPPDQSLAAFVRRRFGGEVLDRLAQPLAGGIYGADPERLSLAATMPRFLALEATHRSVTIGLMRRVRAARARAASGARYHLFASFRRGIGALPEAVAAALGERVRLGASVATLAEGRSGYRLGLASGETIAARRVIVAVPAPRAAALVERLDATLAGHLRAIRYGSAAVVTLAYAREAVPHPLDAYGFVVPAIEGRLVLASTWSSVKWPGRAPAGKVLLRVFLGGATRPEVPRLGDAQLLAAARRELRALMGVEAPPGLVRVDRFLDAMPHYHVGHLDRVEAIEDRASAMAGLSLAGNAYRGVGIPDAVASGERAADEVLRDG